MSNPDEVISSIKSLSVSDEVKSTLLDIISNPKKYLNDNSQDRLLLNSNINVSLSNNNMPSSNVSIGNKAGRDIIMITVNTVNHNNIKNTYNEIFVPQDKPEDSILIGFMIDTSKPMNQNLRKLPKKSGISRSKLNETIDIVKDSLVALYRSKHGQNILPHISLFIYGFGLSKLSFTIYDYLNAQEWSDTTISSSPVRDVLQEANTKFGLPITPTAKELDSNWNQYKECINTMLPDVVIGGPPSLDICLNMVYDRFVQEIRLFNYKERILFIIGSGQISRAIDYTSILGSAIRDMGVVIITCFIGDANIIYPYKLYNRSSDTWSKGAKRLYDCSSEMNDHSRVCRSIRTALIDKGWSIPHNSKLFIQVNHSKMINDVIESLTKSFEEY